MACGERKRVQIQSWESSGSAQEEERAQRSFLLWALCPFPGVHAWLRELSQASFSVCGSQIPIALELLPTYKAFAIRHLTDLLPDF